MAAEAAYAASPDTVSTAPERAKPVDVILGTKAQYIKTAPVLRELTRRGIPYRLIDTGQHAALTPDLRRDLDVKDPAILLSDQGNVATLAHAFFWASRIFTETLFRPEKIRKQYFSGDANYCLIHGDTPSTLLSLFLAKRAGKKVAHLEAGLRSYNYFKPFPEELIRIICMHMSDILFAPSQSAVKNLEKMNLRGQVIALPQNTNVEALYHSLKHPKETLDSDEKFALFTIHRVETILDKERLSFVINWARKIADRMRVLFVLHDPTAKRLKKTGLMALLESHHNIHVRPLMSHTEFIRLLKGCDFVVTDGGSIQEEAFFLDTPCLVMRTETERDEGLGANVRLSAFDNAKIEAFLRDYDSLRRGFTEENKSPSAQVVDALTA